MSRSALWRQEGNVKERERRADDLFQAAVAEGSQRQRAKGMLPLWGPADSFHINPLLLQNIIQSPYFQKTCENLTDWNAVVDDIYYQVKHLQPFQTAGTKTPSSAFCLLLRLLTLRMTEHQLKLTLEHVDSPFIRGIGFLYLRFSGPPEQLWTLIQPYIYDQEEMQVTLSGRPTTVGDFVRHLFSSRDYHGTPLPRLPAATERELAVQLLQADKVAARAKQNFNNKERMQLFARVGSKVMALYGDQDNPVTWYEAEVDRVITRDEAGGHELVHPKYVVTFPEYGNTETVLLGEMDIVNGSWKRGNLGERSGERPDLYEEVRRRERDTVVAGQRGQWGRRPPASMSQPNRQSHLRQDDDGPRHNPPPQQARGDTADRREAPRAAEPPQRKRTSEEMAATADKKRKLLSKYG